MVVGEFVAASRGLGYLMSFAQSTFNAALMFAVIFLILVVVLAIFAAAGRLEKRLLRWSWWNILRDGESGRRQRRSLGTGEYVSPSLIRAMILTVLALAIGLNLGLSRRTGSQIGSPRYKVQSVHVIRRCCC